MMDRCNNLATGKRNTEEEIATPMQIMTSNRARVLP
jgi:hypothetical protein